MKNKFFYFILMHFGFLLFSMYTVVGKFASKYDFFSVPWCLHYCLVIFILFIYALIWQQVLKKISLSIGTSNKAITIVWGMFWSAIIFNTSVTFKQLIGTVVIFCGILVLSFSEGNKDAQ